MSGRWHVGNWLAFSPGALAVVGLVFIGFYAYSTPGAHATYLGVGMSLRSRLPLRRAEGRLLRRAEAVASNAANATLVSEDAGDAQDVPQRDAQTVGGFTPSTNPSEVSGSLTELLVGAGLVQLTRLGNRSVPSSMLCDGSARGPDQRATVQHRMVMVGSILVMYFVLGFLTGYVLTTPWYGRRLNRL